MQRNYRNQQEMRWFDMNLDTWQELKGKDELGFCKDCGKKIWVYWHTKILDQFKRKVYPLMERCANCHFKHERGTN